MYKTIAIIKPDAVERHLTGSILLRIEQSGFQILGLQMLVPAYSKLEEHYREHAKKDFYIPLLESMVGRIVVVGLVHRTDPHFTVEFFRTLLDSIRSNYAIDYRRNSIHGSSSDSAAEAEMNIWFSEGFT